MHWKATIRGVILYKCVVIEFQINFYNIQIYTFTKSAGKKCKIVP